MPTSKPDSTNFVQAFMRFAQETGLSVYQNELKLWQAYLAKYANPDQWTINSLHQYLSAQPVTGASLHTLIRFAQTLPIFQRNTAVQNFLLALKTDHCSEATIRNYRSDINQFCDFFPQTPLLQLITKPNILSFLKNQVELGLKPASIKRKGAALIQFSFWLETHQYISPVTAWLRPTIQSFNPEKTSTKPVVYSSGNSDLATSTIKSQIKKPKRFGWLFAKKSTEVKPNLNPISPRLATSERLNNQVSASITRQLMPWITMGMIAVFATGVAVFGSRQFISQAVRSLANTLPTSLKVPSNVLSFQGRLTDIAKNPITVATTVEFRLYDNVSGGNLLWDSGSCSITPDQDGIFTSSLGSDCGASIGTDVFANNTNVWLEVQVVSETLTPRQPIRSVAYALNSATLQGYPASASATRNTVLVMDNTGSVVLDENNSNLTANNGTFTVTAPTLSLKTKASSNGSIYLVPDGTGKVGIGTSSPTFKLDVNGTLGVGGTAYFGGRVGIGTSAPAYGLDVTGGLGVGGTANFSSNVGIGQTAAGYALGVGGNVNLLSGNAYYIAGTSVLDATTLGNGVVNSSLTKVGALNSGSITTGFSSIDVGDDTITTTGNIGTYLSTTHLGLAVSISGRLGVGGTAYFNNAVGIGTTTPTQALHVAGNMRLTGDLYDQNNQPGSDNYILVSLGSGVSWVPGSALGIGATSGSGGWTDGGSSVYLSTTADNVGIGTSSTGTAKLAIAGGNVGIGTSSPAYLLDVNGTLGVGGTAYFAQAVGIGTSAPGGSLEIGQSVTATSASTYYQMKLNNTYTGTMSSGTPVTAIYGIYNRPNIGIGGTSPHIANMFVNYNSANLGLGNSVGITNLYNLYVAAPTLGAGSSATNTYALVTEAGAGNVGIGVTNPVYKLDVNGTLGVGGTAYFGSIVGIGQTAVSAYALSVDGDVNLNTGHAYYIGGNSVLSAISLGSGVTASSLTSVGALNGGSIATGFGAIDTGADNITTTGTMGVGSSTTFLGLATSISGRLGVGGTAYFNNAVGIGTTTPTQALHVAGNMRLTGDLYDQNNQPGADNNILISLGSGVSWVSGSYLGIGGSTFWNKTGSTVHLLTSSDSVGIGVSSVGTAKLAVYGGNVGIGTSSPGYALDIVGSANLSSGNGYYINGTSVLDATTLGNGVVNSSLTKVGVLNSGSINTGFGSIDTGADNITTTGNIGTYTSTSFLGLSVSISGRLGVGGTAYFNGPVGIGTTNPGAALDISVGNLDLDNTTNANQYGIVTKAGNNFIHNFNYGNNGSVTTDGYNTFLGVSAGNLTMGATATQTIESSYNTAIGNSSLSANTTGYRNVGLGFKSLFANTTGYQNTALGDRALRDNTDGNSNIAIGYLTLANNLTGNNNVAIGTATLTNADGASNTAVGNNAMYNNASGNLNTAIGQSALFGLTTGDNNVALGHLAGRYIAGGGVANQTSGTSLYLGNSTKSLADGDTNEIVIGYNTTGIGSNSVVLGNDNITKTALKGSVGIGTTAPTYKLDVTGGLGVGGTANFTANVGIGQTAAGYALGVGGNVNLLSGNAYYIAGSSVLDATTLGNGVVNSSLTKVGVLNSGSINTGFGSIDTGADNITTTGNIGTYTSTSFLGLSVSISGRLGVGGTAYFNGPVGIGTSTPLSTLEVNGVGSFSLGSVTAPGIAFNDDLNTGLWSSAPDFMNFSTGGTERMRIDSSGNVGIGISSALTAKLSVGGTASLITNTSGDLKISANQDLALVPTSNVGVGTSGPTFKLHVNGTLGVGGTAWFGGNVGVGVSNPGALLDVGLAGTTAGVMRLAGSTSGNVSIGVSAVAGTWTLTLPNGAGSNGQQLTTNGAGVTSWSAAGSTRAIKDVIGNVTPTEGLNNILNTPIYRFHYKPGKGTGDTLTEYVGVMADEAPWAMHYDGTIINPVNTLGYMVLGIQAEDAKIAALDTKVNNLNQPVYFDQDGQISLDQQNDGSYRLTATATGQPIITKVLTATQSVFGTVRAGLVKTKDLVVEQSANINNLSVANLTINGQSLADYITSIVNSNQSSTPTSPIAVISPTPTPDQTQLNLAKLLVTDTTTTNNLSAENIQTQDLKVTGTTALGSLISDGDATISGSLDVTASISAQSARIAQLEAGMAQLDHVKATTAELMEATVSGTLYADNIANLDQQIADAFTQPSLLGLLTGSNPSTPSSNLNPLYESVIAAGITTSSSTFAQTPADLGLPANSVVLNADAAYLTTYFEVNGTAFVADSLGIGGKLHIGTQMEIGSDYIALANGAADTLKIQPSGKGKVEILAGVMTLDETGYVNVNGSLAVRDDLKVGKTLLAGLLQPVDFNNPLQVQVAGISTQSGELKQSRFEIINELGAPVATISATGKADFADGIGIGSERLGAPVSSQSAQLQSNKTAGTAIMTAGTTELTINSTAMTDQTIVQITPQGSTQNQVLYVKSQTAQSPENNGKFVVAIDSAVTKDISFSWWLIQ